jgi:hypothetical protein
VTGARKAYAPGRGESTFGWIVDSDFTCDPDGDPEGAYIVAGNWHWSEFGRIGPRNIPDPIRDRLRLLRGRWVAQRWRCLDDDGIVYYQGRYVGPGDERMFAPLDNFARPHAGCTAIEYLDTNTNLWRPL